MAAVPFMTEAVSSNQENSSNEASTAFTIAGIALDASKDT